MFEKILKNPSQKIYSARITMVFVLVLTLVSTFLLIINTTISFPFSLFSPQYFAYISYLFYTMGETDSAIFYLVIALIIFGFYFFLYRRSKTKPKAYTYALILFSLDTILMVIIETISFSLVIDLAFHLWIMYTLFSAVLIVRKGLHNEGL